MVFIFKKNSIAFFFVDEQNNHQLKQSNMTRSEQIDNNDEQCLRQVPRLKHLPNDGMSCLSFFFFTLSNDKTFFFSHL
jgi:hypothetical protein